MGNRKLQLTGMTFRYLTVVSYYGQASYGSTLWQCLCECGRELVAVGARLRSGRTSSCGCHSYDEMGDRKTKHGHARRGPHDNRRPAREYDAWVRMIRRCTNPKDSQYARYGGRGITVCARWMESVEAFIVQDDTCDCPLMPLAQAVVNDDERLQKVDAAAAEKALAALDEKGGG